MVAATGLGSGLDIEGLVSSLVRAERTPVESRLVREEAQTTAKISAFARLQGALGGFQTSVEKLTNLNTFNQRSASSSDRDAVRVSVDRTASAGDFRVGVNALAEAQSLASGSFASADSVVGEGTLTFRFGTVTATPPAETPSGGPQTFDAFTENADRTSQTITIDSSNNTLAGIRDAINEADMGVSAVIVNDGGGARLLMNSMETGAANGVEIQATETTNAGSGLSNFAFNATTANLTQTAAAQDARFTVNGLEVSSAANEVTDVVDGVTLTLRETTEDAVDISIEENTGAVRSAIESLVSSYNSFVGTLNSVTAFNAETREAADLTGDATARSLQNRLRSALSAPANGFDGPFSTLAEIGITTQADGTLDIDDSRLDTALEDNFDSIAGLFAQTGRVADAGLRFDRASGSTAPGRFDVDVSRLATQGAATVSGVDDFVVTGANNSFTVTVDGTESGAIDLAQADYGSGAALAAELEARINADDALSNAGRSVTVSFEAGVLEVRSDRFGSASTVALDGIDASSFSLTDASTLAATDGVDVAGTIGGVAAEGVGQQLRATSGDAEGVRISVTGGALGNRGSVDIAAGVGVSLNTLLDSYLDSDGILASRTDGLETIIDRIEDDRERLELRLEAVEARIRDEFNGLDALLANLQSTSQFLTTQLANIPVPGVDRDN